MARPIKQLDWTEIGKLAGLHCTHEEIASFVGVSLDTIERACKRELKLSFAEYYKQKRSLGKVSIRRKQFAVAMEGNVSMLIWLGKQILGQMDKSKEEQENELKVANAKQLTKEQLIELSKSARKAKDESSS